MRIQTALIVVATLRAPVEVRHLPVERVCVCVCVVLGVAVKLSLLFFKTNLVLNTDVMWLQTNHFTISAGQ